MIPIYIFGNDEDETFRANHKKGDIAFLVPLFITQINIPTKLMIPVVFYERTGGLL